MIKPNYDNGSIVNLMASLTQGLGTPPGRYAPLDLLDPRDVTAANTVVLLVLDGVGYNYLHDHPSAFDRYLRGRMTSVFPSSTAPAITSFVTGSAPQQHAVSGWFMNLRELGTVAMILPFCSRWGGAPFESAGIGASELIARPPLFDKLDVESYVIIGDKLVNSCYTRATAGRAARVSYRDFQDCLAGIQRIVKSNPQRKLIYAYWPLFDALAHSHGAGSGQATMHFHELAQGFAALAEALRGTHTLLIATADHGFVDTTPASTVRLADHPELESCLSLPLCGEPRAAFCYVRAGKAKLFEAYVCDRLQTCCELHRSEELVAAGWFGAGEPEPRLLERVGDYVLLTKDHYVIKDTLPFEKNWQDIGVHGGASADEMYVPLIIGI
jgi:hypothetical protein